MAADPTVSWIQFRSYSGPRILGADPMPAPVGHTDELSHVARAYWLTTKVETGAKFGAVVMYDGTGVTGGPDQHVAVYPKELANEDYNAADDQGGLWKLMRRLEYADGDSSYHVAVSRLWMALGAHGWYVSQDGALRYTDDTEDAAGRARKAGDLVNGNEIRDALTPTGGRVPRSGPAWDKARSWALMFNEVLAHPDGHRAQIEFGKEHLVERVQSRRINLGTKAKPSWKKLSGIYPAEVSSLRVGGASWDEGLDLAMCVYQSHSVNAPAIANRCLARAVKLQGGITRGDFPEKLISYLGTSTYGRWDDDIKNGRYQRTRSAARASGLWSRGLFDGPAAIMPRDLPG